MPLAPTLTHGRTYQKPSKIIYTNKNFVVTFFWKINKKFLQRNRIFCPKLFLTTPLHEQFERRWTEKFYWLKTIRWKYYETKTWLSKFCVEKAKMIENGTIPRIFRHFYGANLVRCQIVWQSPKLISQHCRFFGIIACFQVSDIFISRNWQIRSGKLSHLTCCYLTLILVLDINFSSESKSEL